jgi:hypothetical protein
LGAKKPHGSALWKVVGSYQDAVCGVRSAVLFERRSSYTSAGDVPVLLLLLDPFVHLLVVHLLHLRVLKIGFIGQ